MIDPAKVEYWKIAWHLKSLVAPKTAEAKWRLKIGRIKLKIVLEIIPKARQGFSETYEGLSFFSQVFLPQTKELQST